MRRTGHLRRLVSGFLAGMTLLSTVLSPMTAYAAEPKAEEKPPLYEEVKDLLDEDEVVKAKDYERMIKLNVMSCVECGMCSYCCPSRIELTDAMRNAKTVTKFKLSQMKK